jgi:hypothetical protein
MPSDSRPAVAPAAAADPERKVVHGQIAAVPVARSYNGQRGIRQAGLGVGDGMSSTTLFVGSRLLQEPGPYPVLLGMPPG